ncbi:MAG: hypothetical protein EBZ50_04005 [Alphaproteobacteria bacterium]|nr:hypothetical protein [Alphaproteobacteria bacterium]
MKAAHERKDRHEQDPAPERRRTFARSESLEAFSDFGRIAAALDVARERIKRATPGPNPPSPISLDCVAASDCVEVI